VARSPFEVRDLLFPESPYYKVVAHGDGKWARDVHAKAPKEKEQSPEEGEPTPSTRRPIRIGKEERGGNPQEQDGRGLQSLRAAARGHGTSFGDGNLIHDRKIARTF